MTQRSPLVFSILAIASLGAAITPAQAAGSGIGNGVTDPDRARRNWMMQCQGCHRRDATGTEGATPAMAGLVARFLEVDGGREYLIRVPGVANAAVGDAELAELLNWILVTFDPGHVPDSFSPFTAAEVGRHRSRPYVTEAGAVRALLLQRMATGGKPPATGPAKGP